MKHGNPEARRALLPTLALALLPLLACHYHRDDDDDHFLVVVSTIEAEPNDESASPHFLGVLRDGEAMIVEGDVEAGDPAFDDVFDGFAVSLTEPTEIEFALHFDDVAGELDVWVYDPAIDDIALFFESDFSPERGVFVVNPPVLDFQIIVVGHAGASPYRLELYARDVHGFSSPPATVGPAAPEPGARGVVEEAPGFPTTERPLPTPLRGELRDSYLGRTAAAAVAEPPVQVGALYAVDEDGGVVALPLFATPGGVPVARLPY